MDVVRALEAADGVTCLVGAGGKKTTMAALSARLDRAVVTATVRIPIFDDWVGRVVVTDDPVAALDAAGPPGGDDAGRTTGDAAGADPAPAPGPGPGPDANGTPTPTPTWPLGLVPERERADRYRGYDRPVVDRLAAAHDGPVLVKADGARMRRLKAPADHEPRVPDAADVVVPVASAHVIGEPLSDALVHRVDRVAALTGRAPGDEIRPVDVARVLASPDGGRKDVGEATAIPLVNMVDDDDLLARAREVADAVHARADVPRVVLAEMRADDPVVEVREG